MTNSKHTATPWKYEQSTKTIRSEKENYWLATMDSWDGAINNEANAEFIVRAVNSHEDLIKACKRASEYLHKYHDKSLVYADGIMAMQYCDEALKLAEGK